MSRLSIAHKVVNHQPFTSNPEEENEALLDDTKSSIDDSDRPSVLKGTAGYIIVTEFCERLAYFGFAGSIVLFFQTHMNMKNAEADIQMSGELFAVIHTKIIYFYVRCSF